MDTLLLDLRQTIRSLAKARGFAALAIATLALGIGGNAAIFGVVDATLLRPLPFDAADRLVRVTGDYAKLSASDVGISNAELFDYRDRTTVFEVITGLFAVNANLTEVDNPERIEAQLVSPSYFAVLNVPAAVGRVFNETDGTAGITEIAVITDGLWRRRFGADPNVLGRKFRLDGDLYTIVGVLPAWFHHPGRGIEGEPEMFSPAGYMAPPFRGLQRDRYNLNGALARLRPGVTVEAAQAQLDALAVTLKTENPGDYPDTRGWRPRVVPLQTDLVGSTRATLLLLMAAVGAVLLIACANVANLLLARATGRRREFALRGALGASRARLLRQSLTESVVLALLGGLAGLLTMGWLAAALRALAPAAIARAAAAPIDVRIVLFTAGLSLLTGLVFGLLPALQQSAARPHETLAATSRSTSGSVRHSRARGLLVITEFAVTLVLLVTAALLVRSLAKLYAVDPGFSPDRVLAARLWMPQPNNPQLGAYFTHEKRVTLFREALRRIDELPGVAKAGWIQRLPFIGSALPIPFQIDGEPVEASLRTRAERIFASPGYFETLGIGLQQGRAFENRDDVKSETVAIVSDSFVHRYLPNGNPIGKRIRPGGPGSTAAWATVVGVVGDVRNSKLDVEPPPQVYQSVWQFSNLNMSLVVRAQRDFAGLEASIRGAVRSLDGDLPLFAVRPLRELMASTVAERQFAMIGIGAFALVALVLAAVGIYGVLSYLVQQRAGEIGVRMALGADASDVVRLVLREGLALAAVGIGLGLVGALAAARSLSGLLYGVRPFDPLSFAGIAAALTMVAVLACYLPARRATRVDPAVVLRAS